MELELKISSLVNTLIERAKRRGLTGDRFKISITARWPRPEKTGGEKKTSPED